MWQEVEKSDTGPFCMFDDVERAADKLVESAPVAPNKKVYPISAPQPIGCFKHEEGVSCSRDFGPKFRCGKIPCEFIFHRAPI
jgi:hypothetical protein